MEWGPQHFILRARARRHHVVDFRAPLSIKSVVSGSAVWRTDDATFNLEPGAYLILNNQHSYSMEADAPVPLESFCVFFRDGFVEDIARVRTSSSDALLDSTSSSSQQFVEALAHNDHVQARLDRLRLKTVPEEQGLIALGEAIVDADRTLRQMRARVPATKLSTRQELLRRVLRARDFAEASLDIAPTLQQIAQAAALSPYHLHRTFRQVFGETLHQYLTRRRLERAEDLLRNTALTVTDVSSAVGYQSVTSFITLFRRHFGVSPREARKNSQDSIRLGKVMQLRSAS
jgi:AraC family transcriptional regulator